MKPPITSGVQMTPEELNVWQEVRIKDTWRVFRIMGEFVEGFEVMSRIGPCVSVFGSARTPPGTPYYELGVAVGRALVERGYGVITGGGPGIMEAANKGAQEAGGEGREGRGRCTCSKGQGRGGSGRRRRLGRRSGVYGEE